MINLKTILSLLGLLVCDASPAPLKKTKQRTLNLAMFDQLCKMQISLSC